MSCVTLLLTGVPHFVTLRDLSYYLDQLFTTDEIATFKLRALPNHPQTRKRQIALDFQYGFDAMAAQEKLDGYTYEMENGREYTLHAKINKSEEYTPSGSGSPEYSRSSQWLRDSWKALAIVPDMSDKDMHIANARLDARLRLLRKCQLVQKKEREILRENQRLRRHYGGAMIRSLYDDRDWTQQKNYDCDEHDTVTERSSPPKISRSRSRERSVPRYARSRSREPRSRGSGSGDRGYTLPQIGWHDLDNMTRELTSLERDLSRSHKRLSRERRSCSRDSRDRIRNSGTRYNELRERRSRSNERAQTNRRRDSGSRERTLYDPKRQSFMSPGVDRKANREALLYQSHKSKSNRKRSPTDTVELIDIKNKVIKAEKDEIFHTKKDAPSKYKTDSDLEKKQSAKEIKMMDKLNSKLRKAEKLELRVYELSKDVMILLAIMVDKIMDKDKIEISASNKVKMIKELEIIVQDRLDPIVRIKKYTDIGVMKSYKAKYPVEDDVIVIKRMLEKIPRLEVMEPQATIIASTKNEVKSPVREKEGEIWDVDSVNQPECTHRTQIENAPVEIIDNTQIKEEPKEEPMIIDLDSSDKPIPRHPQFVVVIKTIVKNMKNVIRAHNLGEQIQLAELRHVLRHTLRDMLKNEGYLPREEIMRRFRTKYPIEDDEQFVRNIIKDIKDGKYPGLTGHIDAPVNEAADDVVVVEKQNDIITVADSDDESVDAKSKIEVINLDNEVSQDNLDSNSLSPNNPDTTSGPSNIAQNTDSVNVIEKELSPDFSQDVIVIDPGEDTSDSADIGNNTGSDDIGVNKTESRNTATTNIDITNTGTGKISRTMIGKADLANASLTNKNHGDPSQGHATSSPIGQDKIMPVNTGQNMNKPAVCQANLSVHFPVKLTEKETKQTADLETLIQHLESKEIQETADKTSKCSDSKEIKTINRTNEDNDNNLKVTAITICTSIEELIAKTTNAKKPEDEKPAEEIKEEVEFEEDAELDESSLHIDSAPRVTSITIMTSEAELLSLGNEEHQKKKVDNIKNETEVNYDAEDNIEDDLVNIIEKAFGDVNFSKSIMENREQNNGTNLQESEDVNNLADDQNFRGDIEC